MFVYRICIIQNSDIYWLKGKYGRNYIKTAHKILSKQIYDERVAVDIVADIKRRNNFPGCDIRIVYEDSHVEWDL